MGVCRRRQRQGGSVVGVGGDQFVYEGGRPVHWACRVLYLVVEAGRLWEGQWDHWLLHIDVAMCLIEVRIHGGRGRDQCGLGPLMVVSLVRGLLVHL